jgi:SAM-dependent methyltransferase
MQARRVGSADAPVVVDERADVRFHELARQAGLDPDDRFVGGYVAHEWDHARHVFDGLYFSVEGARVLEFGCHIGGTACVLAALGAHVTGIDPDARFLDVARANAERYGLASRTAFLHVPETSRMPFETGLFDIISCASVFEYVPEESLGEVQREIARVLKPGGHLVVFATGNRIWPRETHHRRWLVNYIPPSFDRVLFGRPVRRGVWPWQVRRGFGGFRDLGHEDGGRGLVAIKSREGASAPALLALRAVNRALKPLGIHHGYLGPQIATVLQKL